MHARTRGRGMSESPVRSVEHAAQTRSNWLDDSSVAHCQDESCGGAFSAMLRRHHCRFCGGILFQVFRAVHHAEDEREGKEALSGLQGLLAALPGELL